MAAFWAGGRGKERSPPLGLALALGPGAVGGLALWRKWPRLGAGAFAWTLGLAAVVSLDWEDGSCGYTPGGPWPWPAGGWGWPPPGGP